MRRAAGRTARIRIGLAVLALLGCLLPLGGCAEEPRLSAPEAAYVQLFHDGTSVMLDDPEQIRRVSQAAEALVLEEIAHPGGETEILLYQINWYSAEQEDLLHIFLLEGERLSWRGRLYRVLSGGAELAALVEELGGGAFSGGE